MPLHLLPEKDFRKVFFDDLEDQDFLIEAIKAIDLSIRCYTAMNGQEGLNILEANAVPFPSLIFLDLNMPRIDGRKFLKAIKRHPEFNTIPVIVYTTSDNEDDRHEVMDLGATDYLVKQSDFSSTEGQFSHRYFIH
jgi:CheY-like chemotaxis protein